MRAPHSDKVFQALMWIKGTKQNVEEKTKGLHEGKAKENDEGKWLTQFGRSSILPSYLSSCLFEGPVGLVLSTRRT